MNTFLTEKEITENKQIIIYICTSYFDTNQHFKIRVRCINIYLYFENLNY